MKITTEKFELELTKKQEKVVNKLIEDGAIVIKEFHRDNIKFDIDTFIFLQYCFEHKVKF